MIEFLSPLSEKNPVVGTLTELHNEFEDKYTGHPIEILSHQSEVNPAEFTLTITKRKYPLQIIDYALRMKVTLKVKNHDMPVPQMNLVNIFPMPMEITIPEHLEDGKEIPKRNLCIRRRIIPYFVEQPTIKRISRKKRQGRARKRRI